MARFDHAPIDRHEALAPLSRDHYVGLVQARHLMKAADADAAMRRKAVAEFLDAWDTEIVPHFADEDRVLAGLLGEADRTRLSAEHREITRLADQARELRRQTGPSPRTLGEIGEALERHIRWEERELFTRLQDTLIAGQLRELGRLTASIEKSRPRHACRRGGEGEAGS